MSAPDPFALHANPSLYVPRPATERILAQLETLVTDQRRPALLVGPPGIGKTFLLRCLAKRLAGQLLSVYVPIPTLTPTEICQWILDQLGEDIGQDPALTLANVSTRLQAQSSALLLLVDDFASMPKETLKQLLELWWVSEGGLRLVFASIEDERCRALLPDLEGSVAVVPFRETMTAAETAEYLRARLSGSDVEDEVSARFDEALLARIQRETGGVPALVNAAGETVLFAVRYRQELPEEDFSEDVAADQLKKVSDEPALNFKHSGLPAEDDFAAARRDGHRRKKEPHPQEGAEAEAKRRTEAEAEARRREQEARLRAEEQAVRKTAEEQRRIEEERLRKAAEEAEAKRRTEAEAEARRREAEESLRAGAEEARAIAASILAREKHITEDGATKKGVSSKIWVATAGVGLVLLLGAMFLQFGGDAKRSTLKSVESPISEHREASALESATSLSSSPSEAKAQSDATALLTETSQAQESNATSALGAASEEAPLSESLALEPVLVSVNATPWAIIEVDGIEFGETPLAEIPLLPGLHKFVAKMPGGRVVERTIQIDQKTQQIVFD